MPLGTARPAKLEQPPSSSTLINLGPPSPGGSIRSSKRQHAERTDSQEEEFELIRSYEYGHGATLPTAHVSMSSPTITAPPSQPRRFAAGGFDPYQGRTPAEMLGEDKVQEKGPQQAYAKAGLQPVVNPNVNGAGGGGGVAVKGRYESLIPEKRPPRTPNEFIVTSFYFIVSLVTRLWGIGRSPYVIWDEAHFGKFGSHYLKSEFYFDVHPPLGKMLVGLAGLFSGYRGQFEFKSGEKYPDDVNYVGMRIILALFGVAMVPVAYSTSGALGWNWRARHVLAIMVLCDNAWLVISRFILLDSMLLFFTFTTVHGLVMFHRQQNRAFGEKWWFWLTFTGLSIGCVASVKWVGLFVTALVGYYTVEDLWDKFGDLRMPVRTYVRHWCARILCLIVVPAIVYMTCFKIHFLILSNSGPGDAQMSSLFQAHLRGNDFAQAPLEAAFGSKVTFKNMGYGGGLLHSHIQTYPQGSQQQQVTCYHYKDNNNEFIVTPRWEDPPIAEDGAPRQLRNGDTMRLVHASTGRNLHSHTVAAPVTKENYEVSCYGNATIGDSNDYWVVEVVDDIMSRKKSQKGDVIKSLTTRMRFRHQNLGCYLRAANAILPQWGWKQIEVSCDKENNPRDEHTYWNIESHWNDKLPKGNTKLYRSPFLRDFIHLNVAMMTSNNALIPDADKEDILASKPLDWPWLWNGLRMNGWGDTQIKYYLIGNPVIWWGSTASLFGFLGVMGFYLGRMQRRHADLSPQDFNQFVFVAKIAGLGWFLHYLPFLMMARVCYLHHYLPTLYFAVLMLVHLLDHFFWNPSTARYRVRGGGGLRAPLSEARQNLVFALVLALVVGAFWWLHGTAYGVDGPMWKQRAVKWRKSWNIHDG